MSLYSRHALPLLINFAMAREELTRFRSAHIPNARGVVVEIGIGSGLNLPFYSSAVTKLYGVDPSAELLALARPKAEGLSFGVEFLQQEAERMALADGAADTVVMTWSLCSVGDPARALRELRRLLKPAGVLIFVEHGLAPDAGVRTWQNRLTPAWRRVGGCHLNRKIDDLIRSAGFTIAGLHAGYIPGPRVATFMYEGRATLEH
jgi:ubiquinone/menaquinone biosynthesis C-methylase UbiE